MSASPERKSSAIDFNTPALQRYRIWRYTKDYLATIVIGSGGVGVLLAILLIFVYLLYEIVPLFNSAEINKHSAFPVPVAQTGKIPARAVYLSIEEQNEIALRVSADGQATFFRINDGSVVGNVSLADSNTQVNAIAIHSDESRLIAIASEEGVMIARHNYRTSWPDDQRVITPRIDFPYGEKALQLDEQPVPINKLAFSDEEDALLLAAIRGDGQLAIWRFAKEEDFLSEELQLVRQKLSVVMPKGKALELVIDASQRWMFVLTDKSEIVIYDLSDRENGTVSPHSKIRLDSPVTEMKMLLGGISLLTAHQNGAIKQWFMSREKSQNSNNSQYYLAEIRSFEGEGGTPVHLAVEQRRKGFLSITDNGYVNLFHSTAHRRVLAESVFSSQALSVAISPRADRLMVETEDGQIATWAIDNEHPEVSWAALWDKVWYESYDEPAYTWQSSASTNDFEPKYSLMPLAFGTLKAAFYAMLLGAPLAICGAIYTAYFMEPALRRKIKPLIELMEALPTVILGFLAGLWLAPFMEKNLTSVFMLLVLMPVGILIISYLYHQLPAFLRHSVPAGWEGAILIPFILLIGWACVASNSHVEHWFFGGDMRNWVTNELGISFDQRNALVVGIAMGFAVIPTIFSIAEDAIFSVPRHLSYGSLALGATPWQTLAGVVIPTASPGIFSALMIGLGRAVGETMIVLMATGNTPIMDFNIFEGMRTLAANIAVEVPEAEVGSSHYRVLFLAAFVLFAFTFVVNTGAEIVRQRLRKKYGSL